jgi:ABC-2 type transport system ATP-binding protein
VSRSGYSHHCRVQAPPRPDDALITQGLSKRFGDKLAVDSLDLRVPRGSFFGLVGPNGAGTTTTLRMVTGLLRPDVGLALVDGIDVWQDAVRAKAAIGVVPEEMKLFERLTGHELLTYSGLLRRLPPAMIEERARELLEVLGLADDRDTLVVDYGHGMRKKLALAAALLHGPRVLFLDEPFEAVDPISARNVRAVLEHDVDRGATVVFSSHVMELVEKLCDRVAIIHRGHLVAVGPTDEVRAGGSLEDAFVRVVGADVAAPERLSWLGSGTE